MRSRVMKAFTLLAGALALAPLAAQSVPSTLNYQGRLTDNGTQQNPVSAAVPMQFSIYDDPAAGTRLWREPDADGGSTPVTVSGGVFSVLLGGSGAPLPVSVFSGGAQRWLEITVNGEILTPRQRISATGYANQAESAASAISAQSAASATTAITAATSTNSLQLGGVAPGGYQLATTAACGTNQFVSSIAASGATSCGTPQAAIPLPLNLTGSDAGPLVHVTQNGGGQGIRADVTSGTSSAVVGFNDGLGKGGNFQISNPANATPAIYAYTAGTGDGILSDSANHNGVVGRSWNASNSGVYGENNGAGYGVAGSTQSDLADGVLGVNWGGGPAVHGLANGNGSAGKFEIVTPGNFNAALDVFSAGTGPAGFFGTVSTNPSIVLWVRSDGAGDGIFTGSYGTGNALTAGVSGTGTAVYGRTNGTGRAGQFSVLNSASTAEALFVDNQGGGYAARLLSENAQSIPLRVEAYSASQTANLQSWAVGGSEVASLNPAGVFYGSGAGLTNLNPASIAAGTAAINITGSAGSVTNGVTTTGSYADPAWITSLSGAKITGTVAQAGNATTAGSVTNGVVTTGSYANPAWITSLAGAKITGTVASATSAVSATTAATATNATQLGGVAASGYQLATTQSCGAGQFLSAITPAGGSTCTAPPVNNLSPPISLSAAAAGPTLSVSNSGAGLGIDATSGSADGVHGTSTAANGNGVYGVANNGSQAYGVFGQSAGGVGVFGGSNTGDGVHGESTGHNGVAGISASAGDSGIYGANNGQGKAAFFSNGVANSGAATVGVYAGTLGKGVDVTINNTGNNSAAIAATSNGGGPVVQAITSGSGNAGYFQVSGATNAAPALSVITNGAGNAANFAISNAANSSAALIVSTTGTGLAGYFNGSVTVSGGLNVTGKAYSATTTAGDSAVTLATKGYVDSVSAVPVPLSLSGSLSGAVISAGNSGGSGAVGVSGTSNLNIGVLGVTGNGGNAGVAGFAGPASATTVNTGVFGGSDSGIGVSGSTTSGTGVYGASVSGTAVYGYSSGNTGVSGSAGTAAGVGVKASGAGGAGIALKVVTGGIQVAGAGVATATPVFIQTTTAGNISGDATIITNPLTDGDPNAILIVTHNYNPGGTGGFVLNKAFGVYYTAGKWRIYLEDISAMPAGVSFNVLVIKP